MKLEITKDRFKDIGLVAQQAAVAALYEEAQDLLTNAKALTPVRFGWLKASGQVQPPVVKGDIVECAVTFGNAATPYAIHVHEVLRLRHHPPTQAKFLEAPALAMVVGMESRLRSRIGEAMARLGGP